MTSDNNVKREYHMDFNIVEAANAEDELAIFAGFPDMQPSTSFCLPPAASSSCPSATRGFNHDHLIGQMVLDTIEGFLMIVNESAVIEYASQNVSAYTDYIVDDLVQKPLYTVLQDEDRQLIQPLLDSVAGATPAHSRSIYLTLRLAPVWRPNSASTATGAAPRQPVLLDATLKVQSLSVSDAAATVSRPTRRYLVCLMKPSQQQQQQRQQQTAWPIKSSPSMSQLPATSAAATVAALASSSSTSRNSLPPTPTTQSAQPAPHSLSDFISCQHACSAGNLVMQAACSPALANKQTVQAEFFTGKHWNDLVLHTDRPVWQRHVEEVVTGREVSSGIYRCLVTSNGRLAFVKSRSYLAGQQPEKFASTHCIIRFCVTEDDLTGSPSASLLRQVSHGCGVGNDSPSVPQQTSPKQPQQQQQQQRPALGHRERQELLSLGALYKNCTRQDPERAAALRSRMLTLWADSQQQQAATGVQNVSQSQSQPNLFLSSLPSTASSTAGPPPAVPVTSAGRQPASLLMELLNGPSQHSCAVSISTGKLQDLLKAKESQVRLADQQQVSSTTATPGTPSRKRQLSWPDEPPPQQGAGADAAADSSTHSGVKRKPTAGAQLLAALLSDSTSTSSSTEAVGASSAGGSIRLTVGQGGDVNGDDDGVLDSILSSIDQLRQKQQQQQLPPVTLSLIQRQPPAMPPPPAPTQQQQPLDVGASGGGELADDVVLDIILDMEERHRQPVPDSTTPGSAGSSGGVTASPPAPPTSSGGGGGGGGGGGLLERLLSS